MQNPPHSPAHPPTLSTTPQRILPIPPQTLLEDLTTTYHLLSLDPCARTLGAEQAFIETFCCILWGTQAFQAHVHAVRTTMEKPAVSVEEVRRAQEENLVHGVECVYRERALEVWERCVEFMRGFDAGLAVIMDGARGDWMERWRRCG